MKKAIVILVVIALAAGAVWFWKTKSKKKETGETPKTRIAEVMRGPMVKMIESSGRVVSNLDVEIKCKASGEITELPFEESDEVKKGDLLVRLDPVDEQRNVEKANVSLTASRARLEKAKENLSISRERLESSKKQTKLDLETARVKAEDAEAKAERVRQLYEKKLAGKEEYDTALTTAVQAQASHEQAKIQIEALKTDERDLDQLKKDVTLAQTQVRTDEISLSVAQQRLKETTVYSPIDGIVTARTVQTGQIISSGISNVGGGTSVLTISDLSRIYVLASVDESDIGDVATEQNVIITVDAFPDRMFRGRVERVAPKGVSASNVVTFEVKIEVTGEGKELLKPEMTADAKIMIARKDDALFVPVEAVSRQRGKTMVSVPADGEGKGEKETAEIKTRDIEVETGINDGSNIEIISGLSEGDKIVVRTTADSQWNSGGNNKRMMGGPMMGGPPPGRR